MDENEDLKGLSQEQENEFRAAVQRFIDRHALADWEMTVDVEETAADSFTVKFEIAPPEGSALPAWPMQEITVAKPPMEVAAEIEKLLEEAYQARFPASELHHKQISIVS